MSQFGIDGARELAAESHRMARQALAQAASPRRPGGAVAQGAVASVSATSELEGIADFIYTRSS